MDAKAHIPAHVIIMFGLFNNTKKRVNNDSRPIKVVKVAEGIYHIVYAD